MEGPGRGPAYAIDTSTMLWGRIESIWGDRPSYLVSVSKLCSTWHYSRGLVLHVEPITCGQDDATEHGLPRYSCDVVVGSYK